MTSENFATFATLLRHHFSKSLRWIFLAVNFPHFVRINGRNLAKRSKINLNTNMYLFLIRIHLHLDFGARGAFAFTARPLAFSHNRDPFSEHRFRRALFFI